MRPSLVTNPLLELLLIYGICYRVKIVPIICVTIKKKKLVMFKNSNLRQVKRLQNQQLGRDAKLVVIEYKKTEENR